MASVLRIAAAGLRQRTAAAPTTTIRLFASTGKRHGGKGCKFQGCKYEPQKVEEIRNCVKKAQEERAEMTKTVNDINKKQAKPWASVNIMGRPLNLPGPISLLWRLIEEIGKAM